MVDYKVHLDVFEGPMDLLLHLIKEQEINIYDIPISKITKQYFEHLEHMKQLNLEVAGEWLIMAATLTYIKSKMLLPVVPTEDGEEEGVDPRDELVRRLIEYKKYKEAAQGLREKELIQTSTFARTFITEWDEDDADYLKEISITKLMEAFRKILIKAGEEGLYEIKLEEISITEKIAYVLETLEKTPRTRFEDLFAEAKGRMELVGTLLALLELMKQQMIRVFQEKEFGPIWVQASENEGDESREGEIETVSAIINEIDA